MATSAQVPRSSVVVVQNKDWVGVYASTAWWCVVVGGACIDALSCMDSEPKCKVAPDDLVSNFRRRHPEIVRALRACPKARSGHRVGAPDICIWRWRGARKVALLEVKLRGDRLSDVQNTCISRLGGLADGAAGSDELARLRTLAPRDRVEPLFGRGRARLALLPPSTKVKLDWSAIAAKARQRGLRAVEGAATRMLRSSSTLTSARVAKQKHSRLEGSSKRSGPKRIRVNASQ